MSDDSARLEALLQAVPIFAALERVELARLVGALEEADLAAREVIFEEGGESDGLYIVQSGQVHMTIRTPGGERLLREVGAGMLFGEVGLLLGRCAASATACTAVRLWKVPRERFDELVRESPAFVLALAGSVAALYDDRVRSSVGAPRRRRRPPPGRRARPGGSRRNPGSRCTARWWPWPSRPRSPSSRGGHLRRAG
jgi:CRP-like cAMP-binding protein